jgi:hypothetical protein
MRTLVGCCPCSVIRVALSLTVAAAAVSAGQQPVAQRPMGIIDGMVSDTGLVPIAGATVSLLRTAVQVETGASGRFRIVQLPAGQYLVVVRRLGFAPVSGVVDVPANDTVRLAYSLVPAAVTLDSVVTTEHLTTMRIVDFEYRRRLGLGQFIDQDQIEKRNAGETADLLRPLLGIDIRHDRRGGSFVIGSRVKCPAQVFVDGVRMMGTGPPPDLTLLPGPKDLAGIELYTNVAGMPPEYAGNGTRCGVLLLWTKGG